MPSDPEKREIKMLPRRLRGTDDEEDDGVVGEDLESGDEAAEGLEVVSALSKKDIDILEEINVRWRCRSRGRYGRSRV